MPGHTVYVEQGAGLGQRLHRRGLQRRSGAKILPTADEVWAKAEMIMKVKEPIAVEWPRMRAGQLIYTYFHFAAAEELTRAVIESRRDRGGLRDGPAAQRRAAAAHADVRGGRADGGAGRRQVPGEGLRRDAASCWAACPAWRPGEVVIIGGGVVGINAAKMAAGTGRPRHHPRHLARPAALPRRRAARQRRHRLLQPAQHPRRHPAGRPGGRRGAAARAPRRRTWSSAPTSS